MDRSTTAKALKKLTEKGYIKKVHPPNNKKDWILFVTEEGAALNTCMESAVNQPLFQLYQKLSDRDISKLYKLMQIMDENIVSAYMEYKVQPSQTTSPSLSTGSITLPSSEQNP